jgi:hypothetical protein
MENSKSGNFSSCIVLPLDGGGSVVVFYFL